MPFADREANLQYWKAYYFKNKSRKDAQRRAWDEANPELSRQHGRDWFKRLRDMAINARGEKCVRCGYSDRRALQFNHINGNGKSERGRKEYNAMLKSIASGGRDDIELVCANCNCIHRIENGL